MSRRRAALRRPQRGATLLGVLVLLGLLAVAQAVVLEQWSVARQREREAELRFVGEQYRRALASYERVTPLGASAQPQRLEDLLEDRRFPRPVAHLRQLWPDPFTGRADWQLIRAGAGIVGVHSTATTPVFRPPPTAQDRAEPALARDWRFVHVPGTSLRARLPAP